MHGSSEASGALGGWFLGIIKCAAEWGIGSGVEDQAEVLSAVRCDSAVVNEAAAL